jgi:hypothetical protein
MTPKEEIIKGWGEQQSKLLENMSAQLNSVIDAMDHKDLCNNTSN